MPTKIMVPELGESVLEATLAQWLKQPGDHVRAGEAVVVLETDKVTLEVAADQDGVLTSIERSEGDDVRMGDVLGIIAETVAASLEHTGRIPSEDGKRSRTAGPLDRPAKVDESGDRVTPVAKRMAQEHNLDVSRIVASKPGGKVTKEDVERYMAKPGGGQAAAREQREPAPSLPSQGQHPEREERVRMSRRRRTIAQRLVEAQRTAAMLTTFNEIDMSAVMELRERRKEAFKMRYNVSLGIASFFVKASIGALKAFPQLNAEIQGDEMILKHYFDIGMAIGDAEGLVVPVLRDADRLSFAEIENAIKTYAQKAQEGTLSLEDLRGGTFTITNGGVFGSLLSTPILNAPQVGILGLHKIEPRPIAASGQVVIRPMMYVALSYDHRIVDGREAVQFLVRIKELTEDPERLLLEG